MPGISRTITNAQSVAPWLNQVRALAIKNPHAFIQSQVKVVTDQGMAIPFRYKFDQIQIAKTLTMLKDRALKGRNPLKGVDYFGLKTRQVGSSTQMCALDWTSAWGQDNIECVIVAQGELRAAELLLKCKFFHSSLRPSLRMKLANDAKAGMRYADTRGSVIIVPANNIEAARGGTKQRLLLSEFCYYRRPVYVLKELKQFCKGRTTECKIETTGRIRGGEAHDFWLYNKGLMGTSREEFYCHFLPWQDDPEKCIQFESDHDRDMLIGEALEYEPRLADRMKYYKWSPGQLVYAYWQLKGQCQGDYEYYLQEYPCDDDEAWRTTGESYFGVEVVNALHPEDFDEIAEYYTFENFPLTQSFKSLTQLTKKKREAVTESTSARGPHRPYLKIWGGAKSGRQYLVSGDSGQGDGGNPSSAYVLDMHSLEMMAHAHGDWRPDEFAYVLASLCEMYNAGEAMPEANGPGIATLQELKKAWPHIFRWRYFDNNKVKLSNKLGWWTSSASRPIMLTHMKRIVEDWVRERLFTQGLIKCKALVNEMKTFCDLVGDGFPEATPGSTDDRVMSYAIALIGCHLETLGQQNDISRLYKPDGHVAKPVIYTEQEPIEVIERLIMAERRGGIYVEGEESFIDSGINGYGDYGDWGLY